jgi:quercetin dioxygenase-like cupin family protein
MRSEISRRSEVAKWLSPPYKIKNVETVVKGTDVQVRVFTLAPGESIPWHFHRDSSDYYFVLEGLLSISTREPASMRTLSIGQSDKITPGTPHLIANGARRTAAFCWYRGSAHTIGMPWKNKHAQLGPVTEHMRCCMRVSTGLRRRRGLGKLGTAFAYC